MFPNSTVDLSGCMNLIETLLDEKQNRLYEDKSQRTAAEAQKQQDRLER